MVMPLRKANWSVSLARPYGNGLIILMVRLFQEILYKLNAIFILFCNLWHIKFYFVDIYFVLLYCKTDTCINKISKYSPLKCKEDLFKILHEDSSPFYQTWIVTYIFIRTFCLPNLTSPTKHKLILINVQGRIFENSLLSQSVCVLFVSSRSRRIKT